jgi:hypothetical protein
VLDLPRASWRLASGLRPFLGRPLTRSAVFDRFRRQVEERETAFLSLLDRAVWTNPGSPYRLLFEWAGIGRGDVESSLRRRGVEATLHALCDAGVFVTFDEFKGRRPMVRGARSEPVTAARFDNPASGAVFVGQAGGSSGAARRLAFDFEQLDDDVPCHALFLDNFGLEEHALALWRPVPPGVAGIRRALIHARLGKPVARWFSQTPVAWPAAPAHSAGLTALLTVGARMWGSGFAVARHVPLAGVSRIVRWIDAAVRAGASIHFTTSVSSAIRVCEAARGAGVPLDRVFFALGGEPFSPRRAALFAAAGARTGTLYSMTECGQMGCGCGDAREPDDVHLMPSKVAFIQRGVPGRATAPSTALFLTTLRASTAKVMINVETGDAGVLEQRRCGCAAGEMGLDWHLHSIRSYEKLTTEGMHIPGDDLLALVEDVLPARFGGTSTDYQFVEELAVPLARLILVASPRLGPIDEARLVTTVLDHLGARGSGSRMMADYWRQAGTIRVVRREPASTPSAKIQALVVQQEA